MMTAKFILTTLTYVSIVLSLPTTTLISREINAGKDANLFLVSYGPMGCNGMSNGDWEATWHQNTSSIFPIHAYHLSRDLEPTEQLDFSDAGCEPYLSTAPNAQKKGCYSLETPASCWRLWDHGGP